MIAPAASVGISTAQKAQRTFLIVALVSGIAISLVAFPPRTSRWEASATLRVAPAASNDTNLESYRLTVLASRLVLSTFAHLVEARPTVRRAADTASVSAQGVSASSVTVTGTSNDTVLTITVKAPNEQTASKLAMGLRTEGASYLNDLDNSYVVSASAAAITARKVTAWDLGRINELVLFWDLVFILVIWRYRRGWRGAQR
jgi:capsular polysaccharide biosynthesis protein